MKKTLSFILAALMILSLVSLCSCSNKGTDTPSPEKPHGKTIYVSPDGNDANDGSKESPLATVAGARDAIRKLKSESGLPDGGVTVLFETGEYLVNSTTEFTAEDSGEDGKPIVYASAPDASPVFSGGVSLNASDFVPASDDVKAKIVDKTAAENLLEIDLAATDCYDTNYRTDYPEGWSTHVYRQELYVNNKRQSIARWPNTGYANPYNYRVFYDEETKNASFAIPEDKMAVLKELDSFGYFGCPQYDWSTYRLTMTSANLDVENNCIVFPGFGSQLNGATTFYLFNILPEIDVPGEYYWDPDVNKLYYYPDGSLEGQKIIFSQYDSYWFLLNGASYITFENLTFENGRATVFSSGDEYNSHITISDCTFRCMGADAINLYGDHFLIENNDISELGGGGLTLTGGNTTLIIPSESVVTNNLIHDWSQTYTVYNPGIQLSGLGYEVNHNELYNSPHEAIAFNCGGSIIEYNYIHDVCQQTSDAGAIYTGRRWDWRGNIIRYNFLKDIVDVTCGGAPEGIYLDDNLAGQTCYGNVMVNIGGGAFLIGGGKDNKIYNNIMIGVKSPSVSMDSRGLGWASSTCTYPDGSIWQNLLRTDYLSKLQQYYFPRNLIIVEDGNGSSWYNIDDPGTPSYSYFCRNVIYNPSNEKRLVASGIKSTGDINVIFELHSEPIMYGTFDDNIAYVSSVDVGFVDPENDNYALKEDSIIYRDIIGFEDIPFDKIGRLK